jgi:DNA segregation ATPase FtsK/SpoIIIE, S-DNA-T family
VRPTRNNYTSKGMFYARCMAAAAAVLAIAAAVAFVLLWQLHTAWGFVGVVLVGAVGSCLIALVVVNVLASGLLFELGIRSRFRAVCRERGLASKIATQKGSHRWRYPAAGRLHGNSQSFQLVIRPLLGHSHADWEKAAAAFTMAYGATSTRFRHEGAGRLLMQVGYQPIQAHDFEHRETLPALSAAAWRDQLRRVEVGQDEAGRPGLLPLMGSHILIAGITGAGKGSLIWSILLRLVPAAQAGVVRFWGLDPKRMELAIGRGFFGDRYAASAADLLALLERAHDELLMRADELSEKVRKFDPSETHPLEVLVVDELGYLVALLPDRKDREKAEKLLSAVLVLGRALGFVVVGAIQDPRKETLSFRDLFPTRVAMRLPKGMVDLVLGSGMYEAGAQCDLIPATEQDGAGVAFVVDESSTLPVMLRTSWCSDETIRDAALRMKELPEHSPRRLSVVT